MRILRKPKVYLIARPQIAEGLEEFLNENDLEWPTSTEGVTDASRVVEVAGRCCYMSFGKKAGSKTNQAYVNNLLGRDSEGNFREGPSHGSVVEHPCWTFIIVGAGRGFCYDEDTEVLTNEGWKYWNEICGDEEFATLNLETDIIEYQRSSHVVREEYYGRMYKLKSKRVDLLVTPEHRLVHQKYTGLRNKKDSLRPWVVDTPLNLIGKRVKYKRDGKWVGLDHEIINIPDYVSKQTIANKYGEYGEKEIICHGHSFNAEEFAWFLGYWLAEGSLEHSSKGGYLTLIRLWKYSKYFDRVMSCISSLGLTVNVKPNKYNKEMLKIVINGGRSLYEYLKPLGRCYEKFIPFDVKNWSPRLLKILIDAWLNGDGSFTKRGSGEGWTTSKKLSDDMQELALKAGWSATVRIVDRRKEKRSDRWDIQSKRINYVVSLCKIKNRPMVNQNGKIHDEWVNYNGMIYCATVPNGTLYVRRNGRPVWSGNSHEQVRHRAGWAYSQLSTRYCDFEREEQEGTWEPGFVIPPLAQLHPDTELRFKQKLEESQKAYVELLSMIENDLKNDQEFMAQLAEMPKRDQKRTLRKAARGATRDILPIATEAIMTMSANARALWNTIYLRANDQAEAPIRQIYVQIAKIMEKEFPELFQGLTYYKAWDGEECVSLPKDKL